MRSWKLMAVMPGFMRKLPAVPEMELSGVVADPGSSSFKAGDEVFGIIPHNPMTSNRGALAQYVLLKVGFLRTFNVRVLRFESGQTYCRQTRRTVLGNRIWPLGLWNNRCARGIPLRHAPQEGPAHTGGWWELSPGTCSDPDSKGRGRICGNELLGFQC